MTKKNLSNAAWKLRATSALFLTLALSIFPAAFSGAVKAQAPAKATAQTPAKTTASPAGESKGGQKEGIKVHGHWTIEIRNPDGTVVTRREFENALTTGGSLGLDLVLGRVFTVGNWGVVLTGDNNSPWNTFNHYGYIVEPNDPFALGPNISKTLMLSESGGASPKFTLSGSITAEAAGGITQVATNQIFCAAAVNSPSDCLAFSVVDKGHSVTGTTLATPVNVSAGQIIQVTVVISFS
jgi:hypothetical protein